MNPVLILILVLLLVGGGGMYLGPVYATSGVGLVLLVIVILALLGKL